MTSVHACMWSGEVLHQMRIPRCQRRRAVKLCERTRGARRERYRQVDDDCNMDKQPQAGGGALKLSAKQLCLLRHCNCEYGVHSSTRG